MSGITSEERSVAMALLSGIGFAGVVLSLTGMPSGFVPGVIISLGVFLPSFYKLGKEQGWENDAN